MKNIYIALIIFLTGCAGQHNRLSPDHKRDAQYYVNSGYNFLSKQNLINAVEEFDKAITLCKEQYGNGEQAVFAARTPTESLYYMLIATAESKNAVVIASTCADALYLKGYSVLELDKTELAQSLLERAVALSPNNSLYLSELGHILHAKKSWQEALDVFIRSESAAKTYSPDDVKEQELTRAMRGVGYSLIELGRLDEAEKKYNECLKINKNDEAAKQELIYIKQLRDKSK
ncbi:MAG: tetratricopeptide repeat protein [Gammaproteobacteria bacterium]|nr:tetratricopeptide repeat protein [Gammaproteobacteria bacterium]MDH5629449.1 tetratricopeptide repeat protein [Gammaproteobacteria bacterium]